MSSCITLVSRSSPARVLLCVMGQVEVQRAGAPSRRPGADDDRATSGTSDLARVQQSAAALVDVAVLDHDRLRARATSCSIPGSAASRRARLDVPPAPTRARCTEVDAKLAAALRQVPGDGHQADRRRSAGAGDGRAAVPEHCAQCHGSDAGGGKGFPEPARQRLAVRRRAANDHGRRSPTAATGVMPPFGADAGRRGRARTWPPMCARCPGLPHDDVARAARQGDIRDQLRGLPRPRGQGQPGDRRAEPHRRGLALRQLGGDHHRDHHQGHATGLDHALACRRTRICSTKARSSCWPRTSGACRT